MTFYNYTITLFIEKKTTKTMQQAIITLIQERGDLNKLKYWRPISLLCLDYKILTKILANRLKNILQTIISQEQTCSIPQRTILNNLSLIRDTRKLTKENNAKLYILQIDQEKAFNKIDHNFLYKTMTLMGFSNTFVQFISILYNNNISSIINNGFLSNLIQLQTGLKRRCPVSLPLYVIQGEVTTININSNQNIKGIKIQNHNTEITISQYADDSNFLLTEQQSVIYYFEKLKKATGSTINLEKTRVLSINTDQTAYLQKNETNIKILEQYQYIEILGVHFSEDLKETILLNWQNTVTKMENHIQKMSMRHISL